VGFFLQEATTCYPVIHNINTLVVQELVQNKCSLGKFWQTGQGNYCEFVFKFDGYHYIGINMSQYILVKDFFYFFIK